MEDIVRRERLALSLIFLLLVTLAVVTRELVELRRQITGPVKTNNFFGGPAAAPKNHIPTLVEVPGGMQFKVVNVDNRQFLTAEIIQVGPTGPTCESFVEFELDASRRYNPWRFKCPAR